MNDYFYGQYLNEKYKDNKLQLIKNLSLALAGTVGACAIVTCINDCVENKDIVKFDDVKNSYVGLVNEDGIYTKELLKDNNNGIYEDIINNKIFNKNDIVEYYSAVPYFVQTDNVKSEYTKEELSEIIQAFKIGSQEYKYSDEYVKVMK